MSFNWSYYRDVARELTEQAKKAPLPELEEAKCRAAISRAYYAAFGRARAHLIDFDGREEPKGKKGINFHDYVIDAFLVYRDDLTRVGIANCLRDMRDERNEADYNLGCKKIVNMAESAKRNLRWADRVFNLLDSLQAK